MNEQIKCPVCGKVGIPDYHRDNVTCPCCGTDLSIYKLLADSTVHKTQKNKIWKIATTVLSVVAVASIIFAIHLKIGNVDIDSLTDKVTELSDSIIVLHSQLDTKEQEISKLKQDLSKATKNIYIVKKNDSPCKISRKVYGTERRYKEIEAVIEKPLQPGDTLLIN